MRTLCHYALTSLVVVSLLNGVRGDLRADEIPGVTYIGDHTPMTTQWPVTGHTVVLDGGQAVPQGTALPPGAVVGQNGTPIVVRMYLPYTTPVRRSPVWYKTYYPQQWYGLPGGGIHPNARRAPVIYTPTDTTQLGYYHQRVPLWLPRPGMIPPPPNPYLLQRWPANYVPPGAPVAPGSGKPAEKEEKKKEIPPIPSQNDSTAIRPTPDPVR